MIARSLVHLALLMLHFIINSHAKSINYAMVPSHVVQLPASLHKGTKDALLVTLVIQNPTCMYVTNIYNDWIVTLCNCNWCKEIHMINSMMVSYYYIYGLKWHNCGRGGGGVEQSGWLPN